jgi:RimJ/RimL family protein N-acetyltransferase
MSVILETERLFFRDHEPRDLEPFCAMEADPEVRRYVGGPPAHAIERKPNSVRFTFRPYPTEWARAERAGTDREVV